MHRRKIREEIMAYLLRFPNAQDSIEGIAQWWVQENEKEIEPVLSELVQEQILGKKECALRTVYFLLNSEPRGNQGMK